MANTPTSDNLHFLTQASYNVYLAQKKKMLVISKILLVIAALAVVRLAKIRETAIFFFHGFRDLVVAWEVQRISADTRWILFSEKL